MKKKLIFCILTSMFCFGQTKNLKTIDLKPIYQENKFPLIVFSKNPKIEYKINTFLQLKHLEIVPSKFDKNPFKKVTKEEISYGDIRFYEWKQNKTQSNILSLTINGEATGAYSEEFEQYENFDLRNGNLILLNKIFTPNGLIKINKKLKAIVKAKIKSYLKKTKSVKNKKASKEDQDYIEEQILLYESCYSEIDDSNINYYDFYFKKNQIVFVRGRCSNHAMRAIDELDQFYVSLPFSTIKQYMSSYGSNLIFNKPEKQIAKSPEGTIFKGKIDNKYPITAVVYEIDFDDNFTMMYWYDKVKNPIELSGKFEKNHFSLVEYEKHDDFSKEWTIQAKIEANFVQNNKIIGTWTNKKTGEALKFELKEY